MVYWKLQRLEFFNWELTEVLDFCVIADFGSWVLVMFHCQYVLCENLNVFMVLLSSFVSWFKNVGCIW